MHPPASGPKYALVRFRLVALLLVFSLLALAIPTRFIRIIPSAEAASPDIVISQVYGGGGNSGGIYKNDFIELFNRGTSPVTVTGWSVQYVSAGGPTSSTPWQKTDLTGTIQPGRYYLVQEAAGASTTQPALPAPEATGAIPMSANAGKVALVTNTTLLTCGATNNCSSVSSIKDFVGYGNTSSNMATAFEGAAAAPTLSNSTADIRAGGGCTDNDNNSTDFSSGAPNPRNSATAANVCGGGGTTAPSITGQPQSTSIQSGQAATLSVTAGGTAPLSYQWYQGTAPSTSTPVGTNSSSYTTPALTSTTSYWVRVSNSAGTADSSTATITVNAQNPTNPTGTGSASPASVFPGASTLLTVNVTPGANPPSTGLGVTANLSSIGGSPSQVFSGGGSTFTYTATVDPSTTPGPKALPVTITDAENRSATFNINLTVKSPPPPQDHVVISEIYGANGNLYRSDYVELYNPTSQTVLLKNWSVQYASATGSFSSFNTLSLGGAIGPHEYYLVKLATSAAGTNELTAFNAEGSINMSGTTGKVALVKNGAPLTSTNSACPLDDPELVDFVGYGTAGCFENTVAPAPGASTAIFRDASGTDTNDNGVDFTAGAPNPQSTATPLDAAPEVTSADTDSELGDTAETPVDATILLTFSEPVVVGGTWYDLTCDQTGQHDTTLAAGPRTWAITTNSNFVQGEKCHFTVIASQVKDADEDDAQPGTDFMEADFTQTYTVVVGALAPEPADVHLALGNPSGAVTDPVNSANNYLMSKPEFALSYNNSHGTANWVSWHLTDAWKGGIRRIDTFRPDPTLPADWYHVQYLDYIGSGFDRGHMTPSDDRDLSQPVNQATFLMTNIIPQAGDNNQGPWANMESNLRSLLTDNELYIVAGGAGTGGYNVNPATTQNAQPVMTIANGRVTVPAQTWKVVLVIPKGGGDSISRVNCGTRTIAVIMPNTQGIRNVDWTTYMKSVDQVEALTGYDFFANLPDPIERCVEAGINGNNPPLDTDADNVPDSTDNCDETANPDQADNDSDGVGNVCDDDDDNDGQTDVDEIGCGSDPLVATSKATDTDGDHKPDCVDENDDNDGVADAQDAFPLDPNESVDTDGDGVGNNADLDDDSDGQSDADESACGSDPLNATSKAPDADGDNSPDCVDTDDDNDGVADGADLCPGTPAGTQVNASGCPDGDGDGVADTADNCPAVSNADQLDTDGDTVGNSCDDDDDNDGVADGQDAFPLNPNETVDTDHDGIGNNADTDDDGDQVADAQDAFPLDPNESVDTDGDHVGNNADADDDNDGVNDGADNCPLVANPGQEDFDRDGVGDTCDLVTGPPTTREQCQNEGWRRFDSPRLFKNQGDCIQFVNTGK